MNENDLLFYTFNNVYILDSQACVNFEGLRQDLVNEIKRDTIENREDKDIVESNLELLEKVYNLKYGYDEKLIIEELKAYGVGILKVNDLVNGLIDLKNYYANVESNNANKEIKDNIDKVLVDMTNYFKGM